MVIFARKKLHLIQTVRQTQAFSEGFGDIKLDLKNKSNYFLCLRTYLVIDDRKSLLFIRYLQCFWSNYTMERRYRLYL